ncbi:MAG TPA: ribosomal L7Ae/L30e/S12e/Gadd45 family protein [Syntrophomonadaceae bacterium]|nr:ribosomal L7Ae/L30e/S12e/Gadd45 family protein [Syntrophomonadaceae bacterium]HNX28503.1 ribosomal L7Ae/L30e/S12e/Gadd45 family protein [Syntrophomonadaceae bacterium]HPR93063.1 ribosomal L7Ae/L30e/S12e/Gadd45 family protein [Syntrophomonadaceae bacterium]
MNKIMNLIGLAQKAGKVSNGTESARNSLIKGKAFLLVISNDIAVNTRKDLLISAEKSKIPWIESGNKYELGNCVGKEYRVAVTINDHGIAQRILKEFELTGAEANSMGVV